MTNNANIQLKLKQLSIGYAKDKPVLQNLEVSFECGQLVGLIANNGVGKSTLLKTISGTLAPLSGTILLDEKEITSFSHIDLAKKIAIVLTEKPQLAGFTVYDLVALGRYPHTNLFGNLTEKDKELISGSISRCSIEQLQNKKCNELSDGEFQKAMIARALAQETDVLLLDEPTAFLDYSSKRKLFTLLKNIAEKENKIILVASHDAELLFSFADSILVIKNSSEHSMYSTNVVDANEFLKLIEA